MEETLDQESQAQSKPGFIEQYRTRQYESLLALVATIPDIPYSEDAFEDDLYNLLSAIEFRLGSQCRQVIGNALDRKTVLGKATLSWGDSPNAGIEQFAVVVLQERLLPITNRFVPSESALTIELETLYAISSAKSGNHWNPVINEFLFENVKSLYFSVCPDLDIREVDGQFIDPIFEEFKSCVEKFSFFDELQLRLDELQQLRVREFYAQQREFGKGIGDKSGARDEMQDGDAALSTDDSHNPYGGLEPGALDEEYQERLGSGEVDILDPAYEWEGEGRKFRSGESNTPQNHRGVVIIHNGARRASEALTALTIEIN